MISIRKLLPPDAPAYRVVRLDCLQQFPHYFGADYETERWKPKLAYEAYIEAQPEGQFVFGAFDEEQLVGICGFYREENVRSRHRGRIIQMYVQPSHHGKNIALPLLQATITEAKRLPGLEQVELGVVTTNVAANRLYQKAGFVEYGICPRYMKLGDQYTDERLMVLKS